MGTRTKTGMTLPGPSVRFRLFGVHLSDGDPGKTRSRPEAVQVLPQCPGLRVENDPERKWKMTMDPSKEKHVANSKQVHGMYSTSIII